jgi:hypothetical protein
MAAILGHDIGYTLWVKCDRCGEELMAFGQGADRRPELEAMIRAEGWHHRGADGWLCSRCGAGEPPGACEQS